MKPNIIKFPLEVKEEEKKNIQLECTVSAGSPKPLFFKWYFKAENSERALLSDGDARAMVTSYYNLTKLSYKNAGEYTCEVSNGYDEIDEYKMTLHILRKLLLTLLSSKILPIEIFFIMVS